jgi:hypothetical protein
VRRHGKRDPPWRAPVSYLIKGCISGQIDKKIGKVRQPKKCSAQSEHARTSPKMCARCLFRKEGEISGQLDEQNSDQSERARMRTSPKTYACSLFLGKVIKTKNDQGTILCIKIGSSKL